MGDQTEMKLSDYSQPCMSALPKVSMPTITADNFKIELALINMIERHQFGGERGEDPNLHVQSFIQYCSTIKQKNVIASTT